MIIFMKFDRLYHFVIDSLAIIRFANKTYTASFVQTIISTGLRKVVVREKVWKYTFSLTNVLSDNDFH